MHIFLDFDGVLHKNGERQNFFTNIDFLIGSLRGFHNYSLILSTSHRHNPSMVALFKSKLPNSILLNMKEKLPSEILFEFGSGARINLIEKFLENKNLNLSSNWIAIDDRLDLFKPINEKHVLFNNLIICDEFSGLNFKNMQQIREKLNS